MDASPIRRWPWWPDEGTVGLLRAACLGLALLATPPLAGAEDVPVARPDTEILAEARAAMRDGDLDRAERLLTPLDAAGNPTAVYWMGLFRATGDGPPEERALGVRQVRTAAEGGVAEAQTILGEMYLEGAGVPRDDRLAAAWLERAAEAENADAATSLGRLYQSDRLGVPDLKKAAGLFEKAAFAGQPDAQASLAVMILQGQAGAAPEKSLVWFQRAAEQGQPLALAMLGALHAEGAMVQRNPFQAEEYLFQAVEALLKQGDVEQAEWFRPLLDDVGVTDTARLAELDAALRTARRARDAAFDRRFPGLRWSR